MDDRNFFDRIAPEWDANEVLSTRDKVTKILGYFGFKEGDSVLDLGTGTGVLLPFIAKYIGKEGKITAVDFSSGMLDQAREKFKDLDPCPDFLNLDFENETVPGQYDKIILYCVYPHLHQPVDTLKWLRSVNLKENGSIFIAFPCGPDYINNIHKDRHSESDKLLPPKDLADFLSDNGLEASVLADSPNEYIVKIIR